MPAFPPTRPPGMIEAEAHPATSGRPFRSLLYPQAYLGDDRLRMWSLDIQAVDGGPAMMRQLRDDFLEVVDFSHNGLTSRGVETLVEFILAHGRPVNKLKLVGNNIATLEGVCRLVEDPRCGLRAPKSLAELHLSQNQISADALEKLLESVSRAKGPGPLRAPIWMWVERNRLEEDHLAIIAGRMQSRGLAVCVVGARESQQGGKAGDASVHLVLHAGPEMG